MFLRHKIRRKDGKEHRYWSIVENRRVSGGRTVQRHVLYLGEINDSQQAAWCRTIEALDENRPDRRQIALFPEDRAAPALDCDVVHVRLSGLRLCRPRQCGACWLAFELWDQLLLDDFWSPRLPPSRQGTRWLNVLKTLVSYRLIDPGSEWRLHRQWYEQTAVGDLLGEDFSGPTRTLYIGVWTSAAGAQVGAVQFLRQRWQMLFQADFEVLRTTRPAATSSAILRGQGRRFGHSRDRPRSRLRAGGDRPDRDPRGLPLAYEVMPGNTSDKTTLHDFLQRIEAQHGKARRTCVMDPGIPTEEDLTEMSTAQTPTYYLVDTARGRLSQLE